jgi:chromatin segregation and condensation protein Rec8/ScpA/Scc1 (kleisin family)
LLVAGLELSRDGAALLNQEAAFGEVRVAPVAPAGRELLFGSALELQNT